MSHSSPPHQSSIVEKPVESGSIIETPVTPVQAEPIGAPVTRPEIEPDRRLSWLAWAAAFVLFIFNRKLGLLFFVLLLVFRQYPTFSLKSFLGKPDKSSPKNRS